MGTSLLTAESLQRYCLPCAGNISATAKKRSIIISNTSKATNQLPSIIKAQLSIVSLIEGGNELFYGTLFLFFYN